MINDIALLKLAQKLSFNTNVQAIPLSKSISDIRNGVMATVVGWGDLVENANAGSTTLKKVNVPVITNSNCKKYYGNDLYPGMFCAGYQNGNLDSCQGDSGGPLVANNRVIGIVSWGNGCARPNNPGIYTTVPLFVPWVQNAVARLNGAFQSG